MPWCPKCQAEYRDGFTKCADCGSELVSLPETEEQVACKCEAMPFYEEKHVEEVLLAKINDTVQLSYITSMLEEAEIPYRVIAENIGGYLQIIIGDSFMENSIYVDRGDLQVAQDILKSYHAGFPAE